MTRQQTNQLQLVLPHHTTSCSDGLTVTDVFGHPARCGSHISFPILTMENTQPTSNKPVQKFQLRGISASVFENASKTNGRDSVFYKVAIQRTYKDGETFKTTNSFGRDDLPIVSLLAQRAWEYVLTIQSEKSD